MNITFNSLAKKILPRKARSSSLHQDKPIEPENTTINPTQNIQKDELLTKCNLVLLAIEGIIIKTSKSIESNTFVVSELYRDFEKVYDFKNKQWSLGCFDKFYTNEMNHLQIKYPELTKTEIRICYLVYKQMDTKDIADFLSITPDSVKSRRHRIRKKIGLSREECLNSKLLELINNSRS